MRDMVYLHLPDLADDFAAFTQAARLLTSHNPAGRGQDGNTHTTQHPGNIILYQHRSADPAYLRAQCR